MINFNDYKITLSQCSEGHCIQNLLLNKFYSTQKCDINILKEKNNKLKKLNLIQHLHPYLHLLYYLKI